MAASLLLSPGGDKFYLFLLRFTSYILKLICMNEGKSIGKHLFLSSFVTCREGLVDSSQNKVAHFAMQSHLIRHSDAIQKRSRLACALHMEWEDYASQRSAEYRRLAKESKALTKKLLALEEEQKHRALASTPQRHRVVGGNQALEDKVLSLTAEVADKQRTSRVQKVREMWKVLEKFLESSHYQQEVLDSVVQGRVNMYTVKAQDIVFQIPEIVLQEYKLLDREGVASNTYHAGKLNLICLMEMWRCSLHIIKNQLLKDGLPTFEEELSYTDAGVQAHRAHLSAAKNLRGSLAVLRGALEDSIQRLESQLKAHRDTPSSVQGAGDPSLPLFVPEITIPSLGMDLLPPSPMKINTPKMSDMKTSRVLDLSLLAHDVSSTPDAVRDISLSIHQASQLRHKKLPQKIPTATRNLGQNLGHREPSSKYHTPLPGTSNGEDRLGMTARNEGESSATPAPVHREGRLEPGDLESDRLKSVASGDLHPPNGISRNSFTRNLKGKSKMSTPHRQPPSGGDAASPRLKGASTLQMQTPGEANPLQVNSRRSSSSSSSSSDAMPQRLRGTRFSSTPQLETPKEASRLSKKVSTPHSNLLGEDQATPQLKDMLWAHELLADQIAAAISSPGDSPGSFQSGGGISPDQLHALVDTVAAMGKDAFTSHDLVSRTPSSGRVQSTALGQNTSRLDEKTGFSLVALEEEEEISLVDADHTTPRGREGRDQDLPVDLTTPRGGEGKGYQDHAIPRGREGRDQDPRDTTPRGRDQDHTTPRGSEGRDQDHTTLRGSEGRDQNHTESMHDSRSLRDHTQNSISDQDVSLDEQEPLFTTPKLQPKSPPRPRSSPPRPRASSHSNSPPRQVPGNSTENTPSSSFTSALPLPLYRETFSTPTSTMSFLGDIQPPTPFQHVEFDSDSSEEEYPSSSHHSTLSQGNTGSPLLDHKVGGFPEDLGSGKTPPPTLVDSDKVSPPLSSTELVDLSTPDKAFVSTAHHFTSQQLKEFKTSQPMVGGLMDLSTPDEVSLFSNTAHHFTSQQLKASPLALVDFSTPSKDSMVSPLLASTAYHSTSQASQPMVTALVDFSTPGKDSIVSPPHHSISQPMVAAEPGQDSVISPPLSSTTSQTSQPMLVDFSTPGKDSMVSPPLSSIAHPSLSTDPWMTAMNAKSSYLGMFGDTASPELVSLSESSDSDV